MTRIYSSRTVGGCGIKSVIVMFLMCFLFVLLLSCE
jgi:hypothetical protein